MKMVIIEPLGVDEDKLLSMAKEALGDRVEIVYHDTKATGTQELIERGKDAEIIVVSNLPLNEDVINGCKELKLLAVAFTGIDHIAMDACRKHGGYGVQLRGILHQCGGRPGIRHADQPLQEHNPM